MSSSPAGVRRNALIAVIGGASLVLVFAVGWLLIRGDGPEDTFREWYAKKAAGDCTAYAMLSNDSLNAAGEQDRDEQIAVWQGGCERGDAQEFEWIAGCRWEIVDSESRDGVATLSVERTGCDEEDADFTGEYEVVREHGEWRVVDVLEDG